MIETYTMLGYTLIEVPRTALPERVNFIRNTVGP